MGGRNPTPPSDSTELVEVLRRGRLTDFARRIARARQSVATAAVRLSAQFSNVARLPDCELGPARCFFPGWLVYESLIQRAPGARRIDMSRSWPYQKRPFAYTHQLAERGSNPAWDTSRDGTVSGAPRPARIPTRNTSCNDVGGATRSVAGGFSALWAWVAPTARLPHHRLSAIGPARNAVA
jgi:hypothetical protein